MSIRRGQRAFTLVELIIVVAIFGLIIPGSLLALTALTKTPAEELADLANINDVAYAAKWITRDANQASIFQYDEEDPSQYPWTFIVGNYSHIITYDYDESGDGLVSGQLIRKEDNIGEQTTFAVMRSVNDGDISFELNKDLNLVQATLKSTRDAGGSFRSKEETVYARLLGEYKQPWEWWNAYAMASLVGDMKIQGRSEVHGDVICEGKITLSGSGAGKEVLIKTRDDVGILHANAYNDTSEIGFDFKNTEIWGYATTTGNITGLNRPNVYYHPTEGNPKWEQDYEPIDETLKSLELFAQEVYEDLGIDWFDAGNEKITLDWLLDNGATTVGDTIILRPGIYSSNDEIFLEKAHGFTIHGYVTFVAPEIHLKGDDNTHFSLMSIEPRGIVLWSTGTGLVDDIEISAGDSRFSGVFYVPDGKILLKGHSTGLPTEYASSPVVASAIELKGDGWVIWPGVELEE
jgi:prepilin-type N-terminal cleavage/methylation domain-containing protein